MFTLNCRILGLLEGHSKATGSTYRIITVRSGNDLFKLRVDKDCQGLDKAMDRDVVATLKLTSYNLNPNLTFLSFKLV